MSNMKKKKLPPKVENMPKEELLIFLKKKRECEAAAQKIVISLLDNGISDMNFIKCLPYISQCHYEDVTEERAIVKNCGYPLCSKSLPDNLPSQQYKISCKTNRVFDITMRKNFCSNGCYKSSIFIKEQILTSPLWSRELEDIPSFQLLPLDTAGVLGEEIDLSLVKKVNIEETKDNSFRCFLDFTEASLTEMSMDSQGKSIVIDSVEVSGNTEFSNLDPNNKTNENERSNFECSSKIKEDQPTNLESYSGDETSENQDSNLSCSKIRDEFQNSKVISFEFSENISSVDKTENLTNIDIEEKNISAGDDNKNTKSKPTSTKTSKTSKSTNIVGDVIERRSENKIDPIISEGRKLQVVKEKKSIKKEEKRQKLLNKEKTSRVRQPISVAIVHIEKCLGEWFTLETMLFLFGEVKVKQMVADKGECIKEYLNNMANGLLYKSTSYDQYQQLCRKLNLLELEDRRYDNKAISSKELKPLPHYSMLQEESKNLDIKVRAFFKGEMGIPVGKTNTRMETPGKKEEDERNLEVDFGGLTNLPLVDKTAQNALRRKIVLNSLNKVLPDLLQTLGISSREISGDIRLLVATFNLQANNILFKPAQWSMIVMILIKLLSIRDVVLKKALEMDRANKHLQLLLMSYEQDGGYLDRLLSWLTDIDRLLDSNDTQLTSQF